MVLSDADRQFRREFTAGCIVVGLFVIIIIGGFLYTPNVNRADAGYAPVVNRVSYKCDGSTSGCTIVYVQAPNGLLNYTFTCTYYNNVTSFHLLKDTSGWWIWFHSTYYYFDFVANGIQRGC